VILLFGIPNIILVIKRWRNRSIVENYWKLRSATGGDVHLIGNK
jgi:hypothetical protein